MPFSKHLIFVFTFLFYNFLSLAQIQTVKQLEEAVTKENDALKYEVSIKLINDFIADSENTPYEKYHAYIYKSYTYKRVFNYDQTLLNLDLALQEGLKSDKNAEVQNCISAEKAFVYFDTHQYEKADKLMKKLHDENYQYLESESKCWIIMQEGYLLMQNKKYPEAEKKLDIALSLALKNMPRNAPNIYGKKIELYGRMKLYEKRDEAFKLGIYYAKKFKIIKYEMYLYEVLRNQYQKEENYKSAFSAQQKYDSLNFVYNSINENGKIQRQEKQLDEEKKALELKNEHIQKYFLAITIGILVLLLIIAARLYKINKQKRILVEKENTRIHNEIERITKAINENGNKRLEVSSYNFTDRQKEIISLIQESKTNKEIATTLFISENTVKYHLKIIYDILDIENRSQISYY